MSHTLSDWLTLFSAACWPISFWWMHRISCKQNRMLENLAKETETVRDLSREEHALIHKIEPKIRQVAKKLENVPTSS